MCTWGLPTFADGLFLVISSIQHAFLFYLPQLFAPLVQTKSIKPGPQGQGFPEFGPDRPACNVAAAGVY
jgi:hypothetical protein